MKETENALPDLGHENTGSTSGTTTSNFQQPPDPVSYTHLRAHETDSYLVCRLRFKKIFFFNDTATTEIYT